MRWLALLWSWTLFAEPLIEEAYVTYATSNYFPLIEVLLESMKAFSTRPIIAFGVNADIPFSTTTYPFLIKRRIDVDYPADELLKRGSQTHTAKTLAIMYAKPRVLLEANVRRGVYVDADVVLNAGCDALFQHCSRVGPYPLSPTYPHPAGVPPELMQAMGVPQKSMNLVHNPIIVFSERCTPFLVEWREENRRQGDIPFDITDESIYNVLLWRYGVTECLNVCDPFYPIYRDYIYGSNINQLQNGYRDVIGKIDFYSFHGCKTASMAKKILNALIEKQKMP